MRRQFNFSYITTPLIYIACFIGILAIQFSKGEEFSDFFNGMALQGAYISGKTDPVSDLARLEFTVEGIKFLFSSKTALSLESNDGTIKSLPLKGYRKTRDQLEILFEQNVRFTVHSKDPIGSVYINAEVPDELDPKRLRISYQAAHNAEFTYSRNLPALTGAYNEHRFLTSLPGTSTIDQASNTIYIPVSGQNIVISPLDNSTNLLMAWYSNQDVPITTERYNEIRSQYVAKAYNGWQSRYDTNTGTWSTGDDVSSFNPEIVAAYLAESFHQGNELLPFTEARRAAALNPNDNTILSAPFVGNITKVSAEYSLSANNRLEVLRSRILQQDLSIFREHDLIDFVMFNNGDDIYNNILIQLEDIDFRSLDSKTAVGMAYNYYFQSVSTSLNQKLGILSNIPNEILLQQIVKLEDGLFFSDGNTEIDILDSIKAGLVIRQLGIEEQDKVIQSIGEELIASALLLGNENSFLPVSIQFTGNRITKRSGELTPEAVYPFISDSKYYPKAFSLYDYFGPGHYVWTISEVTLLQGSEQELRLNLRYKTQRFHHLIIYGIENYSLLRLLARDWPQDPRFELYPFGAVHIPEQKAMLLKHTHRRSPDEQIYIRF